MKKHAFAIFYFFAIAYLIGYVALNLWLPGSIHLARSTLDESTFSQPSTVFNHALNRWLTTRTTSEWLLRRKIQGCSLDTFAKGERIEKKGNAISVLVNFLGVEEANREKTLQILWYATRYCDVNIIAEGAEYSPLVLAIIFHEKSAVEILLKSGARPYSLVNRPGKPIDGMNALQLTEHLENKAAAPDVKKTYGEIAELIRQHNAKHLQ